MTNVHGWYTLKVVVAAAMHSPGRAAMRGCSARAAITTRPIYKEEYTMDQNAIIQLVSTLGFPIVCCGALFWRMVKSDEQHKAEMDKFSEALNNNTIVMTRLCEKMGDNGHV